MKTFTDFKNLANKCTYKHGWEILVKQDSRGTYLQIGVTVDAEISYDMIAKENVAWRGKKNYLSPYMCDSEFIGAIFGAIKSAEEHEIREWFRFDGASVYNPHLSIYALRDMARKLKNFEVRENAMTMEEPENPYTSYMNAFEEPFGRPIDQDY